eukprot:2679374-Pyramimonas_sp.AAC.1
MVPPAAFQRQLHHQENDLTSQPLGPGDPRGQGAGEPGGQGRGGGGARGGELRGQGLRGRRSWVREEPGRHRQRCPTRGADRGCPTPSGWRGASRTEGCQGGCKQCGPWWAPKPQPGSRQI